MAPRRQKLRQLSARYRAPSGSGSYPVSSIAILSPTAILFVKAVFFLLLPLLLTALESEKLGFFFFSSSRSLQLRYKAGGSPAKRALTLELGLALL